MTTLNCVENVAEWLKTKFTSPEGEPLRLYEAQRQRAKDAPPIVKGEPVQPIYKGMEVHPFCLPSFLEAEKKAPYIIVQPTSGSDVQTPENPVKTTIGIRLILAVYNPGDDEQEGSRVLQELIDFLRIELERKVVIPDVKQGVASYVLDLVSGVYWEIYNENTRPYSCGWMEMTFDLQSVIREDVLTLI